LSINFVLRNSNVFAPLVRSFVPAFTATMMLRRGYQRRVMIAALYAECNVHDSMTWKQIRKKTPDVLPKHNKNMSSVTSLKDLCESC